jgi:hypothetical protein
MTAKDLKWIFQKGECVSLDTLRLYIDSKLDKKSMHTIEEHLVECTLCSAAADGLTPRRLAEVNKLSSHIEKRLAVYMNTPPRVPFFQRFAGLFILGSIVLITGFSVWYFAKDNAKDDTKTSDTVNQSAVQPNQHNDVVVASSNSNPAFVDNNKTPDIAQSQQIVSNTKASIENLPATAPGEKDKTITVVENQKSNNSSSPTSSSSPQNAPPATNDPSTTRSPGNTTLPLRIKSIQVYPPVTHTSSSGRKQTSDGQLGKSNGSTASFQLDEMPSYPGGDQALRSHIMSNVKLSAADRSKLTRMSTGVLVVVNAKTGQVSSAELSFSISPEIDAEILRVVKAMIWSPGKKRGEVDIMLGITLE